MQATEEGHAWAADLAYFISAQRSPSPGRNEALAESNKPSEAALVHGDVR